MILVDADLLLYSCNSSSLEHSRARVWLEQLFAEQTPVALAWMTVHAVIRISTNPRLFPSPYSVQEAAAIVSNWLQQPALRILEPGERHWDILKDLLSKSNARGEMVTDAVLAAIAIEHGATLCTADYGFQRFPGLKVIYPLERS